MSQVIDHETGEVTIFNQDLALQTDAQIIALSENALQYTIDLIYTGVDLETVQDLRSKAQAMNTLLATHIRTREARIEAANNLSEARVRIERSTGAMIPRLQADGVLATSGSNNKGKSSNGSMTYLADYQITGDQSSTWQKMARVPDDIAEDYYATTKEGGGVISAAGLLAFAKNGLASHQLINTSENNEWYTPPQYIDSVHAVLGEIDVDPASNETANQVIRAKQIYTINDSGLAHDWPGKVFLNPPYGRDEGGSNQDRWSQYLIDQYHEGITTEAILLVNAVPGNKWFARLWEFPICFVDHRIRFYNNDTEAGQPTHSNVFVYMGDNIALFANEFSSHGVVAIGYRGPTWDRLVIS